ncbi:metallophosphoesterase [Halalkalibacter sp. APA_J-10(15)]|uniref:metallophosphoesterase n=1 Tax=Halalkalibacter sp. APA_J-10(15) TaxID=2933805 RepID=UPI001FF583CD|nr:metallophosphoesterase [Halalkalibacter sp. APA_J-10(15)]
MYSLWLIFIVVTLAIAGTATAIVAGVKSASKLVGHLNVLSGYFIMFYVYTLFLLIIQHAVQLIWDLPATLSASVVLVLAFIVTVTGAIRASTFRVDERIIRIPWLKKEVNVMHTSDDVHLGHHNSRDYLSKIAKETNHRKPDFVLINGDLVDSNAALLPGVLDPLSDFKAPIYYVGGNHEKYIDNERVLKLIRQQGVRILHNEVVETHGLQLVGLDYMNADENTFDMHASDHSQTIKSTLSDLRLKKNTPTVLMHHSPVGLQYAEAAGANLMLSGHTHAGQVFPFNLLNELVFNYNKGLHQHGKTRILVSSGAGTYMLRIRLGTSNEINMLRLLPSK